MGHEKRAALTLALALMIVIVSAATIGLDYQFGGYYNEKVYPLVQSHDWFSAAENSVPYDPSAVTYDTERAWALVNQSDAASGYGNGSPCWLWPTPEETYGFADTLMLQIIQSVAHYNGTTGIFTNSTLTSWTAVENMLHQANDVTNGVGAGGTSNIAQCLFNGNKAANIECIGVLLSFPVTMVIGLYLTFRNG
jgi:hypothetical protein